MNNFNYDTFEKYSGTSDHKSYKIIKEAIKTSDEIGSILRTHLYFEKILESWIYSVCNQENFFKDTQLGFYTKLKIALNLGLPAEVSDIASRLNKIRNSIAHNVTTDRSGIDTKLLEGLKDSFKDKIIQRFPGWQEGSVGMSFLDEDGEKISVIWNDPNLKTHELLAVICQLTITYLFFSIFQMPSKAT
ncbi:TPA: hypothetical protein ACFNMI_000965 [Neisseria bacilliformis]